MIILHDWQLVRVALEFLFDDIDIVCPKTLEVALSIASEHKAAIVSPEQYPKATKALSKLLGVVVITTSTRNATIYRALREGASGFLHVSCDLEELESIVEKARKGDPIPLEETKRLLAQFRNNDVTSILTSRQVDVLERLCEGMSFSAIAYELGLKRSYIERVAQCTYERIGVSGNGRAQTRVLAVRWAMEHGVI